VECCFYCSHDVQKYVNINVFFVVVVTCIYFESASFPVISKVETCIYVLTKSCLKFKCELMIYESI